MKIKCQNFGPIKEGSIDISKDLIIICGANNSGKTYLSYLLYGLFKADHLLNLDSYNLVGDLLNQVKVKNGTSYFRIDIVDLLRKQKANIDIAFSKYALETVRLIFPQNNIFLETEIFFDYNEDEIIKLLLTESLGESIMAPKFENAETKEVDIPFISFSKLANNPHLDFKIRRVSADNGSEEITKNEQLCVNDIVFKNFLFQIFGHIKPPVKLFPSERIAIDIFSSAIISSNESLLVESEKTQIMAYVTKGSNLGGSASMNLDEKLPYYILPIKDAIIMSNSAIMASQNNGPFHNLGVRIQDEIISGEIYHKKIGNTYDIVFKNSEVEVPIQFASSVVKSMASVVIYFKHLATKNDILIIDEPELCLHPDLQRKFAVILAKASREGIKVIISTHSDFLIREFNNLIMLHKDSKEAKILRIKYGAIGYSSNSTLNFNRVGINLFRRCLGIARNGDRTIFAVTKH
jgi:hypothetical protein